MLKKIESDFMFLRKLEEKDAELMLEWMHDPMVNCFFQTNFSKSNKESVLKFINDSFTDLNQNFAIVSAMDEYIGTISLKNISYKNRNAEYAIVLRQIAQGNGSAYNSTKEIIRYAFEDLNLHRVYLNVLSSNVKANNFYQKCGFKFEGTFKQHLYINNTYADLNWYGIHK